MKSLWDARFPSRRSTVMSLNGMVATSQPLAAAAGLEILRQGGNAVDAAVATAAALAVVEPMSTGVGGDAWVLVRLPDGAVIGLNASGCAPSAATLAEFTQRGYREMPLEGPLCVTVPGAVDGWATLLAQYGRRSLAEVLAPAIHYAEHGFPVSPVIARAWQASENKLRKHPETARTYLIDGQRAPRPGEVFRQPNLARTLRLIAEGGRSAFYEGEIAEAVGRSIAAEGGLLSAADLAAYRSQWVEPIWTDYHGYRVYECPPNGQGLVALLALNILAGFDLRALPFGTPEAVHLQIEALRLAFADGLRYIADPEVAEVPVAGLLDPAYSEARRASIDPTRAAETVSPGQPRIGDDTVYLTVVDRDRMACSFINSLYYSWGSGVVAGTTGILLQNRGAGFSLDPSHPNAIAPGKRPYHTIIPAMVTHEDKLFMSFGVMGGFMQPQGHVQVLCNIVDWGMDPQTALDAPRFRVVGDEVALEPHWPDETRDALAAMGHRFAPAPEMGAFGGGQIVMVDQRSGALLGASEPRKDGCAIGW